MRTKNGFWYGQVHLTEAGCALTRAVNATINCSNCLRLPERTKYDAVFAHVREIRDIRENFHPVHGTLIIFGEIKFWKHRFMNEF